MGVTNPNYLVFTIISIFFLGFITMDEVDGHKLILTDGKNLGFDSALEIPDHKISWAIYEDLESRDTMFYFFEGKKGDSVYSQIVIPKMEKLEYFSPSLVIIGPGIPIDNTIDTLPFEIIQGTGAAIFDYNGPIPSEEFYEPFGQVTYWERQEIEIRLPESGIFYLVVYDANQQSGKYSLAVGKIEDFSVIDFFYLLPVSWFETKIFFEDYFSAMVPIIVIIGIILMVIYLKKRKPRVVKSLN